MYEKLKSAFNFVGVIDKTKYINHERHENLKEINSIFVVGLAYPFLSLKQEKDKLLASIYTYGFDYHYVMKKLVKDTLKDDFEYDVLVDNHDLDERKLLGLTGLAYLAKNDLMINKDYGSYFFIGLVLSKDKYPEVIKVNNDSCLDCEICIKACPVNALDGGFQIDKCMSAKNQLKSPFSDDLIKKNYLLLGCDICQKVCPKNNIEVKNYLNELQIKETTYVDIIDLFELSNKEFKIKYGKHAYVWLGKTILLRNALTLLLKQKNTNYNDLIQKTIKSDKYPNWYKKDAQKILFALNAIK